MDIPKCHCGKETVYRKNSEGNLYAARCSMKCRSEDKNYCKKISRTKINLYLNKEWKKKTEEKKIATTLKNYGVNYPMQNIEIFEKQQKACFEKDNNGLHGYEPFIYPFLKELYSDITNGTTFLKKNNLQIRWSDNGKLHQSFPDFFVESINSFIEIKSDYTFNKGKKKIEKCQERLKEMNYGYIIVRVNPNKSFAIQNHNLEYIND